VLTVAGSRALVVIPAFGRQELTHAVVGDLAPERALARVIVVDNGGDYLPVRDEVVLRPGANLGWLGGSNLGFRHARQTDPGACVLMLNNDTRLSPGFVAGMLSAARRPRAGVVAPCYDDHLPHMRRGYDGPAAAYRARRREHLVPYVDGTCMLLTPDACAVSAGLAEGFGTTGWGADIDLCVRVRQSGLRVLVTERAYLTHAPASTAKAVHRDGASYWRQGDLDMRRGLAERYGPEWERVTGLAGGRRAALLLRLRRGGV